MTIRVTSRQALAWRMRRQLLDPMGTLPTTAVVHRLCGVQSQVASSAELAIRLRRERSRDGDIARAISAGRLIKTWAMRGALHVLTPKDAGAFLSLMAAGRAWERPSWARYFEMTENEWIAAMDALRHVVREALSNEPLTRAELAVAVRRERALRRLADELGSSWGTLLKPLAWQGDLCFGPSQDGRVTFTRPETGSSRWPGVLDPDVAAPIAIASYLRAYGPATIDAFGNWLSGGWFGKRQIRAWFAALGDRLVEIEVDGEGAVVLAEDVDELAAAKPTSAVRLLPGFDQYVLGPGTGDRRVVPPARRSAVSRQSGWISPVVVAGGVVSGTWQLDGDRVRVAWFSEAGRVPRTSLETEVSRLSSIVDQPLRAEIVSA